ncbi:MAG TPA: hypothetical protein VHN80_26725 [Kineosporiaceae bacterium]|nr:hypothetical protein [Kineosporiaceae bacterium]
MDQDDGHAVQAAREAAEPVASSDAVRRVTTSRTVRSSSIDVSRPKDALSPCSLLVDERFDRSPAARQWLQKPCRAVSRIVDVLSDLTVD